MSLLLLVKLFPNVIFLPLGGILADTCDRRKIQVAIDLCSSCVVLFFLWSVTRGSIVLCLLANFMIEALAGLYGPSNSAMLPQSVGSKNGPGDDDDEDCDEELKKATALYGMTWSITVAAGSSLGGALVAAFGMNGCFLIDSITYLTSAALLNFGVKGNFNASVATNPDTREEKGVGENQKGPAFVKSSLFSSSVLNGNTGATNNLRGNDGTGESLMLLQEQNLIKDGQQHHPHGIQANKGSTGFVGGLEFAFVQDPSVGATALLKGSGSLVHGACDVLNVAFSSRASDTESNFLSPPIKLFACVGIGNIIGSFITEISVSSRPSHLAGLCLFGYFCMFVGCILMAFYPDVFVCICLSNVIRNIGAALIWINSTLIIQNFTPPSFLGRVNSFDCAVNTLSEAFSALAAGFLLDKQSFSEEELSYVLAGISVWFSFFWSPLRIQLKER